LMDRGSATVDGPADEILVVDLQLVQLVRPMTCQERTARETPGAYASILDSIRAARASSSRLILMGSAGASVSSHLQSRHTAVASSCSCPAR
jgi:hypothetical protein